MPGLGRILLAWFMSYFYPCIFLLSRAFDIYLLYLLSNIRTFASVRTFLINSIYSHDCPLPSLPSSALTLKSPKKQFLFHDKIISIHLSSHHTLVWSFTCLHLLGEEIVVELRTSIFTLPPPHILRIIFVFDIRKQRTFFFFSFSYGT